MACQTPLLESGNLGGNGKASLTRAPTTVVARTSPVAAGFDSLDPGGLGDSAPSRMPVCDILCELSNIFGSVPTTTTGVRQVPSGRRFSS